jgi:DNA-directed RNA polymerase specialized sigma24 family protein
MNRGNLSERAGMTIKTGRTKQEEGNPPIDFERFLGWLNPDRDKAGQKYEEIRRGLIEIFTCRGCIVPEDLADKTIDRVAERIQQAAYSYAGEPALYFYKVAHYIHLETYRDNPSLVPPPPLESSLKDEKIHVCLDHCLEMLSTKSRDLVLGYYQEEECAKIMQRKQLALRLNIPLNALRIRAHRIRQVLQACVFQCLEQEPK